MSHLPRLLAAICATMVVLAAPPSDTGISDGDLEPERRMTRCVLFL
jgi:hypothetical protein